MVGELVLAWAPNEGGEALDEGRRATEWDMAAKLKEAVALMNRDVIDARRRLELA